MVTGELFAMVLFALGAGVATFFAPCSYALLPGYVGYYVAATGEETPPLSGALLRGVAASSGSLGAFAVLSVVAIVAGSVLEATLPYLEIGVGIALVVFGGWIVTGGSGGLHVLLPRRRSSVSGFLLFGAMYALAATACVLPLFLSFVFTSFSLPVAETALVLGAYASGFVVLMLSMTVAIAIGHTLGTGRFVDHSGRFVRLAGVLVLLAGLGQLYIALR